MGLFKSFDNLEPIKEDVIKTSGIFTSNENKFSILKNTMQNINDKSDEDIKYFICNEHKNILNYDLFMVHNDTRKIAQDLFKNIRFLKLFLSVINFVNLNKHEIICLNKIAYDYYLLDDTEKDNEVKELLLAISYEINNNQVIQLSAILGINRARLLALIGNSSFKEEKCIKRICNYLVKTDYNYEIELNCQSIVNILLVFINSHYTNIFIAIMTDNVEPETEEEMKIYNLISEAVLVILDSMTSQDIYKVLYQYINYIKITKVSKTRFLFKDVKCSQRIKDILQQIELVNEIFIV